MKIYTRNGDLGETDMMDGSRTKKNSDCMEACGTVDELNATIGLVRAEDTPDEMDKLLEQIQKELFQIGAELVTSKSCAGKNPRITKQHIESIEKTIDSYEASVPPLDCFILPVGTRLAATLHHARTVSRRAERRIITLLESANSETLSTLLPYFNRLSDLLFVLTRVANAQAGHEEVKFHDP